MRDDIEKRVISILAEHANISENEITPTSVVSDLNLDSLNVVEVLFSLEETFDINIPFNANQPNQSNLLTSNVAAIISEVKELIKSTS